MTENRITAMVAGANPIKNFSIAPISPDGMTGTDLTRYNNSKFNEQWAIYLRVTDIQEVIDAKARWVMGKGFTASAKIRGLLKLFRGYGKDTFNTIIESMFAISEIGEDSYAEIIRDDEGDPINLKILNTGRMTLIAGKKGFLSSYEYSNGNFKNGKARTPTPFTLNEIFHLPRNRRGDEIHGRSMIEVLKTLVLAKQEAIADMKTLMHWHVKPRWKHRLKTDDPTEIAAYKIKQDTAKAGGEDIYEPFDVAESELLAVPANATLNPMAWIQYLDAAFYKAAGVPQFIVGGGTGFTEASEKIAYLAWQQTIEKYQLFIEEQVEAQLGLKIKLTFPASLENELLSDNKKDGAQNIDPSETKPESENT